MNAKTATPKGRKKTGKSFFSFVNMPLAGKFALISGILVIGFVSLAAAYYQVTVVNSRATSDTAVITHFGELADSISIQFLDMRRLEKDFIIDQDSSLLEPHQRALTLVEHSIEELLEDPPTEEVASLVEDMSLYLGLYRGSFTEMVNSMTEAGLDERSGYLGALNASARNIEELVFSEGAVQLQNSLFKMRQHERAFIADPRAEYSTALMTEKEAFEDLLATADMDEDVKLFIGGDLDTYADSLLAYGDSLRKLRQERATFSDVAQEFAPILANLKDIKEMLLGKTLAQATASQNSISVIFVLIITLVAVVVNVAFFVLSRIISRPLQQAVKVSAAIAGGQLDNRVDVRSSDETGALLQGLSDMQTQLREQKSQLQQRMDEAERQAEESRRMAADQARMAEEQTRMAEEQGRIATENGRIKQALDGVSSAVLMLGNELDIIYRNDAALSLFRTGEKALRSVNPSFSADALIGKGVDYLYGSGGKDNVLLKNLTDTQTVEKELGGRIYRITASPVVNRDGQRIGTVCEWIDRTAEVAIETEVQTIVGAAMQGDLSQRIDLSNKRGFIHDLSSGVNQMVDVAENVIKDTVKALENLSRGNLTYTMEGNFQGMFAQLKGDVNTTVNKLTDVVRNIQNSAGTVDVVAGEIAESNNEVSMRTEQQAASLEETAAAIEEMTATVRQTASNTIEASNLANEAREQAFAGGDIVNQAITAMTDISKSSKQIANIIGVIDQISFQTNLLALNASVEAARAGEQGRSFSVVADEVRKLAAHSAEAAKEIKGLIDHSNRQVERGAELVNKSGSALTAIVDSIKRVSTIIAEISTASQEQAEGIEQVNASISNMDEGTQQNAAMVENVTQYIHSMREEAQKLNEMMKFFMIAQGQINVGKVPPAHRLQRVV